MISAILDFITGGAASLLGLLMSLLPSVDVSSLPIAVPSQVSGVLGFLNVFIPVGDLLTILTWWAALVVFFNAFKIVSSVVRSVTK